jgi:hypothetical protein
VVVVTIGAVGVAVAYFFGGSIAHGAYFHVEVEVFSGEGVVAVEGNLAVRYFHYLEDRRVIAGAAAKTIAYFKVDIRGKLGASYLYGKVFALFAVRVFRGNFYDLLIAYFGAEELAFEAGDDIARAFKVAQGLAAAGAVEYGSAVIGKGVVNRYNACIRHENLRGRIGT